MQDLEDDSDKLYYVDDDSASESESNSCKKKSYSLDPDHKLLLRSARPLLQSRNAAVSCSSY
jgi:AP-3 complex subunit beta